MLLAEHYVFVTIFSLALALPWVDHSFFFQASQNMALARWSWRPIGYRATLPLSRRRHNILIISLASLVAMMIAP